MRCRRALGSGPRQDGQRVTVGQGQPRPLGQLRGQTCERGTRAPPVSPSASAALGVGHQGPAGAWRVRWIHRVGWSGVGRALVQMDCLSFLSFCLPSQFPI